MLRAFADGGAMAHGVSENDFESLLNTLGGQFVCYFVLRICSVRLARVEESPILT